MLVPHVPPEELLPNPIAKIEGSPHSVPLLHSKLPTDFLSGMRFTAFTPLGNIMLSSPKSHNLILPIATTYLILAGTRLSVPL